MPESPVRMPNKVIGRPKKSSAEMRDSGARTGRIKACEAEERLEAGLPVEEKAVEEKAPAPKMGLGLFIERVKHERKTFFDRLVPGQTVCKDFEGEFTWKPEHPLTVIRTYAEQVVNGCIVAGGFTRQACARFLGDLDAGASRELFIDPVAVDNINTWFKYFGEPEFDLQPWELFIVGQLFGWKLPSGLRRFREAWWEVAKKNGKTALMGGTAIFLTVADQEPNAEIYSLANTRQQAGICFKAAQRWLDGNVELRSNITLVQIRILICERKEAEHLLA
jgi:hypothetical protein